MNNNKTTRNPKKLRRAEQRRLNRQLTAGEIMQVFSAALRAGAPVMADKIISMRGGITVAEAEALVALVNVEAEANGSMTRVVVERKSAEC